jgi:hypothetical protein
MRGNPIPGRNEKDEKRLAWKLASGHGDLIYAVTLLVFLIAVLKALLM